MAVGAKGAATKLWRCVVEIRVLVQRPKSLMRALNRIQNLSKGQHLKENLLHHKRMLMQRMALTAKQTSGEVQQKSMA